MKYTDQNPPLVCMLSTSTCYQKTRRMEPWGVLWHSTGANNSTLKRYVQPADNDPRREELLQIIGKNKYGNDQNHRQGTTGMNFWIGRLADGTVAAVQTMPCDYRPWGCGGGNNGSCNDHWIQFEICEDGLKDEAYAQEAFREACELTAYLCALYGIDPNGMLSFKGKQVPAILCHKDAHSLGLGSNHADVLHWFPKYGLTMQTVRDRVTELLAGAQWTPQPTQPVKPQPAAPLALGDRLLSKATPRLTGPDVTDLQNRLNALGYNTGGADGIFGTGTEAGVMAFQKAAGLSADGKFGPASYNALLSMEAAKTKPKTLCTVIIPDLDEAAADLLIQKYPQAQKSYG